MVEPIEMYQRLVTKRANKFPTYLNAKVPQSHQAYAAVSTILYSWYLQDLHTSFSVLRIIYR